MQVYILVKKLKEIQDVLRSEITRAQEYQWEIENQFWIMESSLLSQNMIWLIAKKIQKQSPVVKLDHRLLNFLLLVEKVGQSANHLELPPPIKIYKIFQVSLLKLAVKD